MIIELGKVLFRGSTTTALVVWTNTACPYPIRPMEQVQTSQSKRNITLRLVKHFRNRTEMAQTGSEYDISATTFFRTKISISSPGNPATSPDDRKWKPLHRATSSFQIMESLSTTSTPNRKILQLMDPFLHRLMHLEENPLSLLLPRIEIIPCHLNRDLFALFAFLTQSCKSFLCKFS